MITTSGSVFKEKVFLFRLCEILPDKGAECTAYERSADEYPEILQGITAGKESRSDRTGGIDACACKIDADKVDKDEGEADDDTCLFSCAEFAVSRAKDNKHEEEGSYHLYEEGSPHSAGIGHAISPETSGEIRG